jgi:hypothetical protein
MLNESFCLDRQEMRERERHEPHAIYSRRFRLSPLRN